MKTSYIITKYLSIYLYNETKLRRTAKKKLAVGAPRGRVVKVAEFAHLTAVSGVGSSPALATRETSQVLLAGVSGGFPPTAWLVSICVK